jgi:hypothetical protein
MLQNAQCLNLAAAGTYTYHNGEKGVACHNSGTYCLALLIVITDIHGTYGTTLTFCTFMQIHRSMQKPVQFLRWANSPRDCSHPAVRNSPRDHLPPTGRIVEYRDSNFIVTSMKM